MIKNKFKYKFNVLFEKYQTVLPYASLYKGKRR
jgi:TorA maturation chaperone TorD